MTAAAVRSEQIRTLYRQSVPVLLANVAVALLVAATLFPTTTHHGLLALWMGAMLAVNLARLGLRHGYRRHASSAADLAPWGVRFVAGSTAAGLLWGAGAVLFLDPAHPLAQILLTFSIGGMCAGAAGTLACHLPAFFGYVVSSLVPLAARMIVVGDPLHLAMGSMTVVYGVALAAVARNNNRSMADAFRLRFENDALLERLSQAQRSLEETNRTLEVRVGERTTALEKQGEALREAQRLEAVGRLAGGIAHDFNNLLTVVLANVSLMIRDKTLDEASRLVLEEVQSAATRGAELVRQLLAFGRRQRLEPRVVDVNDVVARLERLLARLIGENVQMIVTPAPGRALVKVDRGQLEQVIVNLVTNARDAMPNGGTLRVVIARVEPAGDAVVPAGSYVRLSVSDTGVGMDAETRRHVFEPLFTTKGLGKGTGLGLATVHGVIEQSGGHVLVQSEPGSGTTFDIYLPRAAEVEAERPPPPRTRTPRPPRATILLAEDDPEVRVSIERVLRQGGHEVLTAAGGEEALSLSRGHAGSIQILITDLVMAGLGGNELARRLAAERPGLRVLFISGYHPEGAAAGGVDPARRIDYLQKPVTFEALQGRIASLLTMAADPAAPPAGGATKRSS